MIAGPDANFPESKLTSFILAKRQSNCTQDCNKGTCQVIFRTIVWHNTQFEDKLEILDMKFIKIIFFYTTKVLCIFNEISLLYINSFLIIYYAYESQKLVRIHVYTYICATRGRRLCNVKVADEIHSYFALTSVVMRDLNNLVRHVSGNGA